jgi:hypothetical protein
MSEAVLPIQVFLRSCDPRNAVDKACEKFDVVASEDGELIQFNYRQSSPRGVAEAEDCRGLILTKRTYSLILWPFHRFYNHGEKEAAKIELSRATLQTKLDGSLLNLYTYESKKRVATRGKINADGNVGKAAGRTFSELFFETANNKGVKVEDVPAELCLMFELTGPENRVVTPYAESDLTLLAGRSANNHWRELGPRELDEVARTIHVKRPIEYLFKNADHINNMLCSIGGLEEGFVIVDYTEHVNGSFKRIKVKNPKYLAASSYIGNGFDEASALGVIIKREEAELLSYFPEFRGIIERVGNTLSRVCSDMDVRYTRIKELSADRKAFAEQAKQEKIPWVFFQLLDGKSVTVRECLEKTVVNNGELSTDRLKEIWAKLEEMP